MPFAPNPLLEAALQYAGRWWRVFPLHSVWFKDASTAICTCRRGAECTSKGKHPRTREGFKDATTDRAQIEAWWAKWPQANVAIATGNGLTVLDIDGEQGRAELLALLAAHQEGMPATLACRTGNGGHLYWNLTGAHSAAHGKLHVRGEGGYVVAAPSMHASGRAYAWVNQEAVSTPPEWLAEWLLAGGESGKRPQQRPKGKQGTSLPALGPVPLYLRRDVAGGMDGVRVASLAGIATPWSAHEEARLWSALCAIPPSIDGKTWASIGRALHDLDWTEGATDDLGLDMWDEWSKGSPGRGEGLGEYRGRADLEKRWAAFGRSPGRGPIVTIASVYHLAAERGWKWNVLNKENAGLNGHSYDFSAKFDVKASSAPIFVDFDEKGRLKGTTTNAAIAIEALGVTCRKDTFHEKMLVGGHVIDQWAGDLTDDAIAMLRHFCKQEYGFDPGARNCHDATIQLCLKHQFNPVIEYLDRLEWDGVRRIDAWTAKYMSAPHTPFVSAAGRLMLVAAVRRARVPGTKFDQVVVFEGREGTGKSTAIKILAGEDNFSDQPILAGSDREQQEAFTGVWLHEVAELEGMRRTEVQRLKQFISRTEDRARPAYGLIRKDMKRRGIFVGTTNEDTYLKSETGNRRFWPIATGSIDLTGLEADRDQLWAEAAEAEAAKESIVLDVGLRIAAAEEQAARLDGDLWQGIVESVVDGSKPIDNCTLLEVLHDPRFELSSRDFNQNNSTRVARILVKLGFERYRQRDGQKLSWRYRRTEQK